MASTVEKNPGPQGESKGLLERNLEWAQGKLEENRAHHQELLREIAERDKKELMERAEGKVWKSRGGERPTPGVKSLAGIRRDLEEASASAWHHHDPLEQE